MSFRFIHPRGSAGRRARNAHPVGTSDMCLAPSSGSQVNQDSAQAWTNLPRRWLTSLLVIAGLVPATHGTSGYKPSPVGPPVGMGCGMFNAPLKRLFEDIGSNIVIGVANGSEYLFGAHLRR